TGFEQTLSGLRAQRITRTGTPVRPEFQPRDPAACRRTLGLDLSKPVLLVMGGSQGASAINDLVMASIPTFTKAVPELQWFHLTGSKDFERIKQAYAAAQVSARVEPFCEEMNLALGAATLAVSRA